MTATNNAAELPLGRTGSATVRVVETLMAPHMGSGRAPVFATPALVALMEAAAVDCVESGLDESQETLGIHIDVEHIAATPQGMEVTARAELIQRDGRKLTFKLEARDGRELVGRGHHTRIIVDSARFRSKVAAKGAA